MWICNMFATIYHVITVNSTISSSQNDNLREGYKPCDGNMETPSAFMRDGVFYIFVIGRQPATEMKRSRIEVSKGCS